MIYRPAADTGERVTLAISHYEPTATKEWVCWECEESIAADGPAIQRADVDRFFQVHRECDGHPYVDEYPEYRQEG